MFWWTLFTTEMERDGDLPFLDTDIYRIHDSTLGHKVYCKPAHSNRYLNCSSHHHPANKHAILSTLVHRGTALHDQDSLHADFVFLGDIFRQNGYTNQQIRRTLNTPPRVAQPDKRPDSVAFLPYVRPIFNRIGRVLSQHNIKSVGLPPRKISSFLQSVKNDLGLKTPRAYSIPCECGRLHWADEQFD
jgi:hypothetical protein